MDADRLFGARLCLGLLLALLGPAQAVAQANSRGPVPSVPAVVSDLSGSWEGSGVLLGRPAEFEMRWEIAASGFVRLTFRNAWLAADGSRSPVLAAEATYLFRGDAAVGVWVDDRPQRLTLDAVATDSSLVTRWVAPSEQGRTEYVVDRDAVRVRDFVGAPGSERLFAEAVYTRRRDRG